MLLARIMCVGHAVQDYVFSTPDLPSGGKKFRAGNFTSSGGGPAATAAVSIAKMGGDARLVARVGDDAIADAIIRELEAYGVDCALVRRFPGRKSSVSSVIVDDGGERMIVNYRDEEMPAGAGWITQEVAEGADAILADTRWPEGAAAALAAAQSAGVPGILDADAPVPDDRSILGVASHVAFSAQGLRSLVADGDLQGGLAAFHRKYDRWCCVTDGENGVFICSEGSRRTIPAFKSQAVDSLGAGDVWHGAFALALAEKATETDAVIFANAAASIKVSRHGAREGAPTRCEVDDFLQKNASRETVV